MAHLEIRRNTYFDINDQPCILYGCSINKIKDLQILYNLFWSEIQSVDPTLQTDDFLTLCGKSRRILNVAESILKLCNVDLEGLDFPLVAALVHSYTDAKSMPHKGFIAEMHFKPSTQESSGDLVSWEEYYYSTLVNLAEKSGSLETAYQQFESLPQDVIEGYLNTYYDKLKEKISNDPDSSVGKDAKKEKYKKMYDRVFGENGSYTVKQKDGR